MRLTSDISLLHDDKYKAYVQLFAKDMGAFNKAFEEAWFDLTTTYGSGTWSKNAKCDDGYLPPAFLVHYPTMLSSDVVPAQDVGPQVKIAGLACVLMVVASILAFI